MSGKRQMREWSDVADRLGEATYIIELTIALFNKPGLILPTDDIKGLGDKVNRLRKAIKEYEDVWK